MFIITFPTCSYQTSKFWGQKFLTNLGQTWGLFPREVPSLGEISHNPMTFPSSQGAKKKPPNEKNPGTVPCHGTCTSRSLQWSKTLWCHSPSSLATLVLLGSVSKPCTLVNIEIAGKWMFISYSYIMLHDVT